MPSVIFEPLEKLAKWVDYGSLQPVCEVKDGQILRISLKIGDLVKAWTLEDARAGRVSVL